MLMLLMANRSLSCRNTPMRSQSSGLMLASRGGSDSGSDAGSCKVGIVRGEDYMFEFSGKIRVRSYAIRHLIPRNAAQAHLQNVAL